MFFRDGVSFVYLDFFFLDIQIDRLGYIDRQIRIFIYRQGYLDR